MFASVLCSIQGAMGTKGPHFLIFGKWMDCTKEKHFYLSVWTLNEKQHVAKNLSVFPELFPCLSSSCCARLTGRLALASKIRNLFYKKYFFTSLICFVRRCMFVWKTNTGSYRSFPSAVDRPEVVLLILQLKVLAWESAIWTLISDQHFSTLLIQTLGWTAQKAKSYSKDRHVFFPLCAGQDSWYLPLSGSQSWQTLWRINKADKMPPQSFRALKSVPAPNLCYGERKEHPLRERTPPPPPPIW